MKLDEEIQLENVKEHSEEYPVHITVHSVEDGYLAGEPLYTGERRIVLKAVNEGGFNCTQVDLEQLLESLKDKNIITGYNKEFFKVEN